MPGPDPAVAATRVAVRRHLTGTPPDALVLIACSGGADSLALAAAAAFEAAGLARRGGAQKAVRVGAVIVDHGLQPGSADAAEHAAAQCRALGLSPVDVRRVAVPSAGGGGPEARARDARYQALAEASTVHDAHSVWLGHTRDDQAEQVLLGLARGSGIRSLAGMARSRTSYDESPCLRTGDESSPRGTTYERPFLHLPGAITREACAAQGLTPWEDPSNGDPAYARNRVRRALADLGDALGPGLAAGLARTADLARDDADALDAVAARVRADLGDQPWPVAALASHPRAIRGRLWRLLAAQAGCPEVTHAHVAALDALVIAWRGQGPTYLPSGARAHRRDGSVSITPAEGREWSRDQHQGPARHAPDTTKET